MAIPTLPVIPAIHHESGLFHFFTVQAMHQNISLAFAAFHGFILAWYFSCIGTYHGPAGVYLAVTGNTPIDMGAFSLDAVFYFMVFVINSPSIQQQTSLTKSDDKRG